MPFVEQILLRRIKYKFVWKSNILFIKKKYDMEDKYFSKKHAGRIIIKHCEYVLPNVSSTT